MHTTINYFTPQDLLNQQSSQWYPDAVAASNHGHSHNQLHCIPLSLLFPITSSTACELNIGQAVDTNVIDHANRNERRVQASVLVIGNT